MNRKYFPVINKYGSGWSVALFNYYGEISRRSEAYAAKNNAQKVCDELNKEKVSGEK